MTHDLRGHFHYQAEAAERRFDERELRAFKADSAWAGRTGVTSTRMNETDFRTVFGRDRSRVLHSAALRRLADKTQVVGPHSGDTPRTRLTHSLEVGQIARGIAEGLGADPDLTELAGLCHDIGHPPYGHNGEVMLNELAQPAGGFEGNAQTLRILTRLEPKILSPAGTSFGLNLTRASLDAACKYPWTPEHNPRKYGAYQEDAAILAWVRQGHDDYTPPVEAQIMDFSDDIAYSVHDVEDGVLSGRIDLRVLNDFVELAALAERGSAVYGGTAEELIEASYRLAQLRVVQEAINFDGSLRAMVALKRMTSHMVGRFINSVVTASYEWGAINDAPPPFGRMYGKFVVPQETAAEAKLLKTIAVLYVMDDPRHLARQDRQRERIATVYDVLYQGAPGALDPMYRTWWEEADSDAARCRVVIDCIASMTESRLERVAREAAEVTAYL